MKNHDNHLNFFFVLLKEWHHDHYMVLLPRRTPPPVPIPDTYSEATWGLVVIHNVFMNETKVGMFSQRRMEAVKDYCAELVNEDDMRTDMIPEVDTVIKFLEGSSFHAGASRKSKTHVHRMRHRT